MRVPRVRITVRRMMAVTVLVALGLWILITCQRYIENRRRYLAHEQDLGFIKGTISLNEQRVKVLISRGARDSQAAAEAKTISRDLIMLKQSAKQLELRKQKYERAMWHSW